MYQHVFMNINLSFSIERLIYILILCISVSIFYQQVFVVNIGASLKIYEIISLFLLVLFICKDRPKIYGFCSLIIFLLFVVIPSISYIMYLFNADKELYYLRFPEGRTSFRTNIYLAPTLLLVYYYFCWVVINYIISSRLVYQNKEKVIRAFVISATIISLYNLYSFILVMKLGFPDLIPSFLDYRNSPTHVTGRFCGFSDEPGTYIILQTWTVYYLYFYQSHLKLRHISFFRIVNTIALIMTLSSMVLPALLLMCIPLYRKLHIKKKIEVSIASLFFVLGLMKIISHYNLESFVHYIVVEKTTNYVSNPDNTLDSGAYRNFTSRLGMKIFKENPIIGCGGGTSCFFLWKNEKKMGIKEWGERLSATSYPQNCYVKVLAELGITGFIFLLLFLGLVLKKCWRYRKTSSLCNVSLLGTLFIVLVLMAVYPETSLFLWFNIALAMNEVYFLSKNE